MDTRLNRIERFRWLVIIIGLIISYQYFGSSFSFLISIIFILSIAFFFIRDMDVSGALSGISVLGPIVRTVLQGTFLNNLECSDLLEKTNSLLRTYGINHIVDKDEIDTIIVYLLMFCIIWLFDNKDKSALGKHAEGDDPEFRNKTFAEDNEAFCKYLDNKIRDINIKLNWNKATYVPIAAEVEMSAGKKVRRYDDMLKCLKEGRKNTTSLPQIVLNKVKFSIFGKISIVNKAVNVLNRKFESKHIYLVLGDPGSGKSVSLRKLCSDLLEETRITGKTPVYISLKTWTDKKQQWSNSHLPTRKDLIAYIRNELRSDGDQFTEGFLNKYFDKMLENGRWYFVFDSFDEMPCLMSGEKNAVIIQHISKLIYDFLSSPNQNGGIIASRLYNRPAGTLNQTYTLTLQKFSDKRIRTMINQYMSGNVDHLIRHLFKERTDLVTLCRNPFHLSLLINYVQKHDEKFPDNQFDLFKDFIIGRLKECEDRIDDYNLSIDEIYNAAIHMAINMQNHRGLDYPVEMLMENNPSSPKDVWEKCLSILEYVKLCRLGENRKVVSFVHRRFQEFFYVEAMLNGTVSINESDYAGLLDNTGIRDALVLYSQIGTPIQVQSIVEYCCDAIESNIDNIYNIRNEGCVHLVNALYFLTEAFGYRKELLGERITLIASLNEYLVKETDYIVQMAIVNSISLLPADDIQKTVLKVFDLNNRWLNAAIVNNCQIIKKLNRDEEISFCSYFNWLPIEDLFRSFFNIDFSLSLSDCFSYVRFVHMMIAVYIIGIVISSILIMTNNTIVTLFSYFGEFVLSLLRTRSLKEIIMTVSELGSTSQYKSLSMGQNYSTVTKLEASLCLLISFFNYIVFSIELMAAASIRRRFRSKNGNIKKKSKLITTIKRVRISRANGYFNSQRMAVAICYLLISLFLLITNNENQLYLNHKLLKEILLFFIFVITLIGSIIEVIHESKEPFFNFAKLLIEAIKLNNILELVKALPRAVLVFFKITVGMIVVYLSLTAITVLLLVAPVFICRLYGIDITVNHVMSIFFFLCTLLFFMALFIVLAVSAFEYVFDVTWIRKHPVNRISRGDLSENLKMLHLRITRRKYLYSLIHNDVKLEGDWPEKSRAMFDDDVLNKELAQWDCKEYAIDNYFSKGL